MIEKISNSVYNDAVSVNLKMLSKDLQRQEKTLKSLQRTNANYIFRSIPVHFPAAY